MYTRQWRSQDLKILQAYGRAAFLKSLEMH